MTKKILCVFGTRPEAIKMCPVVNALKTHANTFETVVAVTGQHCEMLHQVLDVFKVKPEYDLQIMSPSQTLFNVTASCLLKLKNVLEKERPSIVLVQGDTTTSFAASLACFYQQIPVAHVEAGLRTHNVSSPFPEEFNRQAIGLVAKLHFAPTQGAKQNLLREGKREDAIWVTGNTGIDALRTTVRQECNHEALQWAKGSKLILITAHRRENLCEMHHMFAAIRKVMQKNPSTKAIFPIHMNPSVRKVAHEQLSGFNRIRIVEPLDVVTFHSFMAASHLILTDSGGIQEEAPALGKPVLVMREETERVEAIEAGTAKLVGTSEEGIAREFSRLLEDEEEYARMSQATNPYGDGHASQRIAEVLSQGAFQMNASNSKSIAVVILNYNNFPDTVECIDAILGCENLAIVLVDNASTDTSAEKLEKRYGTAIEFLQMKQNAGYAAGNNAGVKYAVEVLHAQFVCILNNDTIAQPQMFFELATCLDENENCCIVSPVILEWGQNNRIQSAGGSIKLHLGKTPLNHAGEV